MTGDDQLLNTVMKEILASPETRIGVSEIMRILSRDYGRPLHRSCVTKMIIEGIPVRGQADPVRLKAIAVGNHWMTNRRYLEEFVIESTRLNLANMSAAKRRGRHARASVVA